MKKAENGGNGGGGNQGGGSEPEKPEKSSSSTRRSPERALFISSALVVVLFLIHVLILLLVDPFKVLSLSKVNAYAYSSIPLGMAIIFLLDAVYNFKSITSRSVFHFIPLVFAVIFGSFSVHGLIGFAMYLIRHSDVI